MTNTRNKYHLHRPLVSCSYSQKSACCNVVKIVSSLQCRLTSLTNEKAQLEDN